MADSEVKRLVRKHRRYMALIEAVEKKIRFEKQRRSIAIAESRGRYSRRNMAAKTRIFVEGHHLDAQIYKLEKEIVYNA